MAYMNQEKKARIKAALDKVLKPLGIKYSLRVQNYMSITCTIRSAPFNMLADRIKPSEQEVKANPRSRSAILRVAQRLAPQGASA